MEQAKILTVFSHLANPLTSYSIQSFVRPGQNYKRGSSSREEGGRRQDKSAPSATVSKPSKESQVLTVTFPQDSTKHKVEKSDDSSHPKCSCKGKEAARVPRRSLIEGVPPPPHTHKHADTCTYTHTHTHTLLDTHEYSIIGIMNQDFN